MGRGSCVVGCAQFLNKARPDHLFSSEYQNGLMSVKSKSESIQNVKIFNIFLLASLDPSCKDYLISSGGNLSYDWPKLILPSRVQAEIEEVAVLYAPVL